MSRREGQFVSDVFGGTTPSAGKHVREYVLTSHSPKPPSGPLEHGRHRQRPLESLYGGSDDGVRELLQDLGVGVLMHRPNTEIIVANQAAIDMLGLAEAQVVGKKYSDLNLNTIHEDGVVFPVGSHPVAEVCATSKPVRNVVMGVRRDLRNDLVWLLVNAKPQLAPDGTLISVICTFSGLTEHKHVLDQLQQRIGELQTVYELSDAINRAEAIEEVYEIALNGLKHALGVDRAGVLLFDRFDVLKFKASYGLSEDYRKTLQGYWPWAPDVGTQKPLLITNVRKESNLARMLAAITDEGIRAIGLVPLIHRGALLGRFMVCYDQEHEFSAEEVLLIQTVARHIAFAIGRKQAERELRLSEERLRALSAHLQAVREDERTSIAREIHDQLGQVLTRLKIDLSLLADELPREPRHLLERTAGMSALFDATIQTVRRISAQLRPSALDNLGLEAAIEDELSEFQSRTGTECHFNSQMRGLLLDDGRSIAVFRILQEALTNVARHSKASRVEVRLTVKHSHARLSVRDNGSGIPEDQIHSPHSLGLIGMRERALQWKGALNIGKANGSGTVVNVIMPLGDSQ